MKPCTWNGKYTVMAPDAVADWDAIHNWERERFDSMEANLKQGDVLYDVGTENGAISAVYAKFVGPENMVLVEPNPDFWPNIRLTWDTNGYAKPAGTFAGLLAEEPNALAQPDYDPFDRDGWPGCAWDGELLEARAYRYLHEPKHVETTCQTTLDALVANSGVVPDAITMDVEGAELFVLRGAGETLARHKPLVWVSIHPDLGARDYRVSPEQVYAFMTGLGYASYHLGTDHEEHVLFWHDRGPRPILPE